MPKMLKTIDKDNIKNQPKNILEKESKIIKNTEFNFSGLSSETQGLIKSRTQKIKKLLRRSAQDIFDIGKYLTEVKDNLKHGQFYPWLQLELKWSPTSAARFMRVYEKFKSTNLVDLELAPSVLYELASSTVPIAAVNETIELARSGKSITHKQAKAIKKKFIDRKKTEGLKNNNILLDVNSHRIIDSLPILDNTPEAQTPETFIRPKIIQVLPQKRRWNLGKHTLFCQNPNSPKFIDQLPPEISLCLSFPPDRNWNWECDHFDSRMNFFSKYHDLDTSSLIDSIQNIVEITTNDQDNVVVCFIPNPEILSVIDALGCRAFIAEPDRDRCIALLNSRVV